MSSVSRPSPIASPAERVLRTVAKRMRALEPGARKAARRALGAYAQVLFGHRTASGALLFAATMLAPAQGLLGLLGLATSEAWAQALGRPRAHREGGLYTLNGLLVGLALGASFQPGAALFALVPLVTLLTVVVTAALVGMAERYVGVPVLCLPFVLVTWTALLASSKLTALVPAAAPGLAGVASLSALPKMLALFLGSLSACFFQLGLGAGALVLVALLASSRWTAILAACGFVSGYVTWVALGGAPAELAHGYLGLNFVLSGVALGGVFCVLTPRTILLATVCGGLSAVLSAALAAWLHPVALPVLAMPFCLVTALWIYALKTRAEAGGIQLVAGVPGSPEENLGRAVSQARRYPDPAVPAVFLPVLGEWVVTQGHHGRHTHRGLWPHAWDLEVQGPGGEVHRGTGLELADYHAYGAPVLAPADGTVARIAAGRPDNPIGEVDTEQPFGNAVVIEHPGGVFSSLCHLKPGSIRVVVGQVVRAGQRLAEVGSSGRSPVPHLHFQLQRQPEVGAPTCYGELLHYVVHRDDGGRYETHGVPGSGQRIWGVATCAEVRDALTLAPGRTWTWSVTRGETCGSETWQSSIGPLGERVLEATGGLARARIYADARYATVLDYDGPRQSLLGLFYLAMGRVPYLATPEGIAWADTPSGTPFVGGAFRVMHELAMPFAQIGAVETKSRLERSGPLVLVRTELETDALLGGRRLPDRIEVTCAPGRGPVRLEAWRRETSLVRAEVCA